MSKLLIWIVISIASLLSGCKPSLTKSEILEKYTDGESKFIEVRNNRVHYKDQGQGEILLLIHGTASSLHTWDMWSQAFADHFRVIRMDLPGFGLTGPDVSHSYEIEDDVAFISEFLEKLGVSQAHLIGSSLGGRIAWEYSLNYPNQVKSLTLINALGYKQDSWPPAIQLAMLPGMETLMPKLSSRFIYSQSLKDIYFDHRLIDDDTIDRYYELSLYPGNAEAFPKRVKAKLDDQEQRISQIAVPTLILWGAEDRYFPVKNAYRFHEDIKQSQLVIYENVSHLPMEEVTEQSLNDVIQFIRSTVQ